MPQFGVEAEFFGMQGDTAVDVLNGGGISARDDGYHHQSRNYWRVTQDSSVNGEGLELVSPVLRASDSEPAQLEQCGRAVDLLRSNGGTVDVSCGLHVHHDASRLQSDKQLANVLGFYRYFQSAIDKVMPHSRRGDHTYLGPISFSVIEALECGELTLSGLMEYDTGARYQNVNVDALSAHGTLEFRQHSGTLNPDKVKHWVKLTNCIMGTRTTNWRDLDGDGASLFTMLKLLPGLSPADKKFYVSRALKFRKGTQDAEDVDADHRSYYEPEESCSTCGNIDCECCSTCGEYECGCCESCGAPSWRCVCTDTSESESDTRCNCASCRSNRPQS